MSLTIVTASFQFYIVALIGCTSCTIRAACRFQFYIVALIAQGPTGLPRIEAISILYSSINRNGEYPLMIHLCYFNSI